MAFRELGAIQADGGFVGDSLHEKTAGAGVEVDGVELKDGSATIPGGKIVFPAVQIPSANANTMDDYQEGTFTPTLKFGGSSAGITYDTQSGVFTKIGRLVTFQLRIKLTNKGSAAGDVAVAGLPFSASVTAKAFALVPGGQITAAGAYLAYISPTSPTEMWPHYVVSGAGAVRMNDTHFANTSDLYVSGSYMAE